MGSMDTDMLQEVKVESLTLGSFIIYRNFDSYKAKKLITLGFFENITHSSHDSRRF